ncbi:MAG: hydantoinase/oxoprolinase family protein, partial [Parvularculaceae bacterium]|nr:hydantoinase/oxoprolinase family protein [Parvularculaceae bacterium]
AAAARAHAVEHGKDIRQRTMIAFGGAAPLHAARLAEKLGVSRVIVPDGAGVGSAIGFLLTPASYEIIRSLPMRLDAFDEKRVASLFASLRKEAEDVVRAAAPGAALTETRAAFMRYVGQGYEVPVPLAAASIAQTRMSVDALRSAFEAAYRALYGRVIPGMAIEILSWSLRVAAPTPLAEKIAPPKALREAAPIGVREAFDAGAKRRLAYSVYDRARLAPGDRVKGPSLIVEAQTTTVVSARFDAAIDGARNIILTRKADL